MARMERLQIHPSESPNRDTEPKSLEIIRRTVGGCRVVKMLRICKSAQVGFEGILFTLGSPQGYPKTACISTICICMF